MKGIAKEIKNDDGINIVVEPLRRQIDRSRPECENGYRYKAGQM